MYCEYYQAKVVKDKIWFIAGCLRNEDHLVFERALARHNNVLEYFVTKDREEEFLDYMKHFQKLGYVLALEKMPNRMHPSFTQSPE